MLNLFQEGVLAVNAVILAYVIWIYSLRLSRNDTPLPFFSKPYSVIIPCYNESPMFLKRCVESVLKANGDKEIILVNNNSNQKNTLRMISTLASKYPQLIVLNENRQGKRFAHSCGLHYAKNGIIVFVDSDTIVERNSFIEIVKPFQYNDCGAVCGNIKIANANNFLTKCLDTMYWNSFEFYRKAVSSLGYQCVCSGALSAYKKESLLALEEEYLNQEFMGVKCSISDDTFMTIRIQSRMGYKVYYISEAVAYTYSPTTIKGFWNQLMRWRKGFIRETLLLWKEPKGNIPFLFFDSQYNLIIQAFLVVFKTLFLLSLIINFSVANLITGLVLFVVSSVLLSIYQMVHKPRSIPYILGYSLLYDTLFMFTFVQAIWEIREQGAWGTR